VHPREARRATQALVAINGTLSVFHVFIFAVRLINHPSLIEDVIDLKVRLGAYFFLSYIYM